MPNTPHNLKLNYKTSLIDFFSPSRIRVFQHPQPRGEILLISITNEAYLLNVRSTASESIQPTTKPARKSIKQISAYDTSPSKTCSSRNLSLYAFFSLFPIESDKFFSPYRYSFAYVCFHFRDLGGGNVWYIVSRTWHNVTSIRN